MAIKRGPWQQLSSKIVYQNPWIKIHEDKVSNPDGSPGLYGYLEKPPGAFIIPQDKDGSIYFLRHFRYPVNTVCIELPCGVIENMKHPVAEAKRELLEETGIVAGKVKKLGKCFVAAGHETTTTYVFLATDLDISELSIDGQEGNEGILGIIKIAPRDLKRKIAKGEINCGISLAALQFIA